MVDELTKHDVVLKSITEPFDTANAAGKMMLQMLGVFAEFEHATIVERTKVGMERKAKSGRFVGAAVENLSPLHLVGRISGSSLEEVAKALAKQNKYIGEATAGNPKAIATFRDLGLTLEDLKGKDAVEIFELISQRITALPSAIQRGKAAMDIFGRSGSNLIPTMKDLADEGLGSVIERARELGVLIDADLAASAERIKDDFELLKAQSEGLGTRLAAGLVPEVSQALQTISGDLAQTTDAWESFGAGIGRVIKWIVAVVSAGFDYAGTYLGMMMSAIDAGIRGLVDLIRGDLDSARRHVQTFGRFATREAERIRDRMKGRFELAVSTPPARAGGETTAGSEGEVGGDAAELAEKRAFEEGLKDIRTHYADRPAIVDRAYEEELAVLEQKRGLLDQITDPGHAGPDSPMHARALHGRLGPPCAATPAQDAQLTRSTAPIILLDVRL